MNYLSKEDLAKLSALIAEVEKNTSGEIRVVVRHKRHWNERKLSVHELALKEFHRLGMEKTTHRTGVLILIIFAEHKFQIIADEGIHKKVQDGTWDAIAEEMSAHFRGGKFVGGIAHAVTAVGSELERH